MFKNTSQCKCYFWSKINNYLFFSDESKNIKRFPTSKSARIGALFDFMDDKVKENVFDSEEFQGIKNAIVEKDEKEEISVKFFKNCKTFSDRCECLSIKGLQKVRFI
jgi:hypothetical protein